MWHNPVVRKIGLLLALLITFIVAVRCMSSSDDAQRGSEITMQTLDDAARQGCVAPFKQVGSDWDLIDNATNRRDPDIGTLRLFSVERDGIDYWCVTTYSGPATRGHEKYMYVEATWYDPSAKPNYLPGIGNDALQNGAKYADYAGGIVTDGPAGTCLAFRGFMVWRGHEYWRTVMTKRCY